MILQRLKCETRPEHERLEHRLDLLDDTISLKRYGALLQGFYGLYVPLENRLLHRPEWHTLGFDVEPRRKVPLLRRDLQSRGFSRAEIEALPLCPALPDVSTFAQVLGCLYVLEGSTLGGQILARHFARVLDIDAHSGAAFFSSYGEHVGAMWRSFGQMLSAQATSRAIENQMIDAARSTFETLEVWLCSTNCAAINSHCHYAEEH
jgi:heme oxygenase